MRTDYPCARRTTTTTTSSIASWCKTSSPLYIGAGCQEGKEEECDTVGKAYTSCSPRPYHTQSPASAKNLTCLLVT